MGDGVRPCSDPDRQFPAPYALEFPPGQMRTTLSLVSRTRLKIATQILVAVTLVSADPEAWRKGPKQPRRIS